MGQSKEHMESNTEWRKQMLLIKEAWGVGKGGFEYNSEWHNFRDGRSPVRKRKWARELNNLLKTAQIISGRQAGAAAFMLSSPHSFYENVQSLFMPNWKPFTKPKEIHAETASPRSPRAPGCTHNTGNRRKPSETAASGPQQTKGWKSALFPFTGSPAQAVWPCLVISSMLTHEKCQNKKQKGGKILFFRKKNYSKKSKERPSWFIELCRKFDNFSVPPLSCLPQPSPGGWRCGVPGIIHIQESQVLPPSCLYLRWRYFGPKHFRKLPDVFWSDGKCWVETCGSATHLLAVWSWARYLTPLSLCCQMGLNNCYRTGRFWGWCDHRCLMAQRSIRKCQPASFSLIF